MEEKSAVNSSISTPTASTENSTNKKSVNKKSVVHAYSGSRTLWRSLCKLFEEKVQENGVKKFLTFDNLVASDCVLKPFNGDLEIFHEKHEQIPRTRCRSNKGLAVAVKLPTGITKEKFYVSIDLEPVRGCTTDKGKLKNVETITLKCVQESDSKSIFTGVFRVPSNTSFSRFSSIPIYLMDTSEKLVLKKVASLCDPLENFLEYDARPPILVKDVKINLQLKKKKLNTSSSKLQRCHFVKEQVSNTSLSTPTPKSVSEQENDSSQSLIKHMKKTCDYEDVQKWLEKEMKLKLEINKASSSSNSNNYRYCNYGLRLLSKLNNAGPKHKKMPQTKTSSKRKVLKCTRSNNSTLDHRQNKCKPGKCKKGHSSYENFQKSKTDLEHVMLTSNRLKEFVENYEVELKDRLHTLSKNELCPSVNSKQSQTKCEESVSYIVDKKNVEEIDKMDYLKNWLTASSMPHLSSSVYVDIGVQYRSSAIDKALDANQSFNNISHSSSSNILSNTAQQNNTSNICDCVTGGVDKHCSNAANSFHPILATSNEDQQADKFKKYKMNDKEALNLLKLARSTLSKYLSEDQVNLVPDNDLLDICSLLPESTIKNRDVSTYSTTRDDDDKNLNQTVDSEFCKTSDTSSVKSFQPKSFYNALFGNQVINTNFQVYPVLISTDINYAKTLEQDSKSLHKINHQLSKEFDNLKRIYTDVYTNLDKILCLGELNANKNSQAYSGAVENIETDLKNVLTDLKTCLLSMENTFNSREVATSTVLDANLCNLKQRHETYLTLENEIKETINQLLKESSCIKKTALLNGVCEDDFLVCIDHNESASICSDIINDIVNTAINTKHEIKDVFNTLVSDVEKTTSNSSIEKHQIGDINHNSKKKLIYFCNTAINSKIPKTSFSFGEGVQTSRSISKAIQRHRESKLTSCNRFRNEILNYNARNIGIKCKTNEDTCVLNVNKTNCCNGEDESIKKNTSAQDHVFQCTEFQSHEGNNSLQNNLDTCELPTVKNVPVEIRKSQKSTKLDANSKAVLPSTSYNLHSSSDNEVFIMNVNLTDTSTTSNNTLAGAIPKRSFKTIEKIPVVSSDEDDDISCVSNKRSLGRSKPLTTLKVDHKPNERTICSDEVLLKPATALPNLQTKDNCLLYSSDISETKIPTDQSDEISSENTNKTIQIHFIKPAYHYTSQQELNTEEEISAIERNVQENLELQHRFTTGLSQEFACIDSLSDCIKFSSPELSPSNRSSVLQVIDGMDNIDFSITPNI